MTLLCTSLHELQHHVFHTSGNDISTSSICRFLHQQCFSRKKKLSLRAQQRSEQLREKYIEEMSVYNPEMLVLVDETGCDRPLWVCPTRETSHL